MMDFLTGAWALATSPAGLVAISLLIGTAAVLAWVEDREAGTTTYWVHGQPVSRREYDAAVAARQAGPHRLILHPSRQTTAEGMVPWRCTCGVDGLAGSRAHAAGQQQLHAMKATTSG